MGLHGAKMINEVFEKRNVQLEYILDEGLTIVEGVYPGISKPVATYASCQVVQRKYMMYPRSLHANLFILGQITKSQLSSTIIFLASRFFREHTASLLQE